MQKKKEIQSFSGTATLFKTDFVRHFQNTIQPKFAKQWPKSLPIKIVNELAWYADTTLYPFKLDFAELYLRQPDFTIWAIQFFRRELNKLDSSPSGRLKKFLATGIMYDVTKGYGKKVSYYTSQDGEIALAFEKWQFDQYGVNLPVSISLVTKARKFCVKKIDEWKQISAKVESFMQKPSV